MAEHSKYKYANSPPAATILKHQENQNNELLSVPLESWYTFHVIPPHDFRCNERQKDSKSSAESSEIKQTNQKNNTIACGLLQNKAKHANKEHRTN